MRINYILRIFFVILIVNFVAGLLISSSNDFLVHHFAGSPWITGIYALAVASVAFIVSQLFDRLIVKVFPAGEILSKRTSLIAYRFTVAISYGIAALLICGVWINYFWGDRYYSSAFLDIVYSWVFFKIAQSLLKHPKLDYEFWHK